MSNGVKYVTSMEFCEMFVGVGEDRQREIKQLLILGRLKIDDAAARGSASQSDNPGADRKGR